MKNSRVTIKHDFNKGSLYLYGINNKLIYYEDSKGYWEKYEYDSSGNGIYYEDSNGKVVEIDKQHNQESD